MCPQYAGKRDANAEKEALQWIAAVTGESIAANADFEKVLKDGVLICKLMNKLSPNSIKQINTKGSNFQLMENHARFQEAAKKYGLPDDEVFQTVDLFEARNIPQVTKCIHALGRITQKHNWTGPALGPKMAEENKREFTAEQIAEAQNTVSQQMGYNKGANASGVNMGNSRHM